MRSKGVYPYQYVGSWKKFEETKLPLKNAFYKKVPAIKTMSMQRKFRIELIWKWKNGKYKYKNMKILS